jgi:HlyD family secretion protein
MKRATLALVVLLAAAALVWAFRPQPFAVEVAAVERGRFEQSVEDDGKTRVRDRYVVSAPLAGRLERIALRVGDRIERDQVLATILPLAPPLIDERTQLELQERAGAANASLARAGAAMERGRATLAKAQSDLERTRKLAAQGFVSAAQVEQSEMTVAVQARELEALQFERHAAAHQRELARAALERSVSAMRGARSERLTIHSPVSGAVLRLFEESQTAVALGTDLLEIGDPAALEAVVDVLSSEAVRIAPGARVRLHHYAEDDAPELEGRVRRVEPAAYTKVSALGIEEQRVNVVIDITSPRALWESLGDGYRIDASIVVASREQALMVPLGALFRTGKGWSVFVVRDGYAHLQAVDAPRRSRTHALIESGLAPGDAVILYPAERVQDRVRVRSLADPRAGPAS